MMNKALYSTRLMELELDCNFATFRSRLHEIAWLAHTRPDSCSAVAMMPQITADKFNRKPIKLMNSKMVVYSDFSFANHEELGTQLGFAMFLTDKILKVELGLVFRL